MIITLIEDRRKRRKARAKVYDKEKILHRPSHHPSFSVSLRLGESLFPSLLELQDIAFAR